MSARDEILGGIRRALRRGELQGEARAGAEARLAAPPVGIVPARSALPPERRVELFCEMAAAVQATVTRVPAAEVPAAVTDWLARNNLAPAAVMAPSAELDRYDWASRPMLALRRGLPVDSDQVAITGAFAGVAETGTLVMVSGPDHPVSLNLMPETHVVVLHEADIVGAYEEVWTRLRRRFGAGAMPRTVNTITGPSRTGDIEQTIELGAHGPKRMQIVVVRD